MPEGFDVAGLVDEVALRLGTSSEILLPPLEFSCETRPIVFLSSFVGPSTTCQVRVMNQRLLEVLGSEVFVSINGFRATHDWCVVSLMLPSGFPCDDENASMSLALWLESPELSKHGFDTCAASYFVVQPSVQVRMVLELVTFSGIITDSADRDIVKLMPGLVFRVDPLSVQAELQFWFRERIAEGEWLRHD